MITLRQLQAFLAVAEHGTFTKAAEHLHVAQPALSQLVRDLERELSLRLFDRTTRRVELTAGGREFHASASKIMEDLELAVSNASNLAGRRRGRIVIAAPPLLAAVILAPVLADMRAQHPGIETSVIDAPTMSLVEAVRLGQADCAIGTFSAGLEGFERIPLARDSLMVFCPPAHPLSARRAVTWADLTGQPLITLTRGSGIRLLVEVGYESAQIPLNPAFEISQVTTAIALVEAGLGLAVLPAYARAGAPHRQVVSRPLNAPKITREIVLVRARDRSPSPAAVAFEAVLRPAIRRLTRNLASG